MHTEIRSEALGPHAYSVLHTDQVAKLLGCAETTVEERARTGDLPGLKFGDAGWVFPAEALMHRLNEKALERNQLNMGKKPREVPVHYAPVVPLTDARGNWLPGYDGRGVGQ